MFQQVAKNAREKLPGPIRRLDENPLPPPHPASALLLFLPLRLLLIEVVPNRNGEAPEK